MARQTRPGAAMGSAPTSPLRQTEAYTSKPLSTCAVGSSRLSTR
jgi:hypothetical protein